MKILKKVLFAIVSILLLLSTLSCREKKVVEDRQYYKGLRALEKKDEKEARRQFLEGVKKCSPYAALKCSEKLISIGNVMERTESAKKLALKWNEKSGVEKAQAGNYENFDFEPLLLGLREISKYREETFIISATENYDITDTDVPNELIRIRLKALAKKNSLNFEKEFEKYYLNRAIDRKNVEEILGRKVGDDDSEILKFRLDCSDRNYKVSFQAFQNILSFMEENGFYPLLISDLGKSALYGAEKFENAAWKFENILGKISSVKENSDIGLSTAGTFLDLGSLVSPAPDFDFDSTVASYNAHFYAGRLYSKAGNYLKSSQNHFKSAMKIAEENELDSQYENALWYLLNTTLSHSMEDAVTFLGDYASKWKNPEYFDDFLDNLLVFLLTNKNYETVAKVFLQSGEYFSKSELSKYAYVTGRLVQEKYIGSPDSLKSRKDFYEECYEKAVKSGSSLYYKIMAASRLNYSDEKMLSVVLNEKISRTESKNGNTEIEKMLSNYETLGFPSLIYSEWVSNRDKISRDASFKAAAFLIKCGQEKDKHHFAVQGLRIADRVFSSDKNAPFTRAEIELAFPRFFENQVKESCERFGISESEMLALIKSESFFDTGISSSAGASGLTQLMEATALDVVNKLKKTDWGKDFAKKNGFNIEEIDAENISEVLKNSGMNINLGAFYISELTGRLENQKILAFLAYNSGITNVRRWAKNIRDDFLKQGKALYRTTGLAPDLFVEIVPFEESRGYGRKIVSAMAVYELLYGSGETEKTEAAGDSLSVSKTVRNMFN